MTVWHTPRPGADKDISTKNSRTGFDFLSKKVDVIGYSVSSHSLSWHVAEVECWIPHPMQAETI